MRRFFRAEVIGFLHTVTAFHCDLFQGEPLFAGTADDNFFMLQIKFIGLHIEHPRRIVQYLSFKRFGGLFNRLTADIRLP